jgi:hypothetical protein
MSSAVLAICAVAANAMPEFRRLANIFVATVVLANIDAVFFIVLSRSCDHVHSATTSTRRPKDFPDRSRRELNPSVLLCRLMYRQLMPGRQL